MHLQVLWWVALQRPRQDTSACALVAAMTYAMSWRIRVHHALRRASEEADSVRTMAVHGQLPKQIWSTQCGKQAIGVSRMQHLRPTTPRTPIRVSAFGLRCLRTPHAAISASRISEFAHAWEQQKMTPALVAAVGLPTLATVAIMATITVTVATPERSATLAEGARMVMVATAAMGQVQPEFVAMVVFSKGKEEAAHRASLRPPTRQNMRASKQSWRTARLQMAPRFHQACTSVGATSV